MIKYNELPVQLERKSIFIKLNLNLDILLIVTLAQSHYRIKVLEEKVKVAFELINKLNDKK